MSARLLLLAAGALAAGSLVPPALAQTSNDKVLMIYGNDRCPPGTICIRGAESERYRIPKTIRDSTPSTTSVGQRDLAASTAAVSAQAQGAGSCSSTGPQGYMGCWSRLMNDAKAERKADAAAAAVPER